MTDTWWPEGYDLPAFRVKRQSYSTSVGGDWVRATSQIQGTLNGGTLPVIPAADAFNRTNESWLLGTPIPSNAPSWQPPPTQLDGNGNPIMPAVVTAKTGHIVRWDGTAWVNIGPGTDLPHTALRYPSTAAEPYDPDIAPAILFARPFDYNTIEILWGWPVQYADKWAEVALVRSTFGHPSTPRDGTTIFRSLRADFMSEDDEPVLGPPPVVYDHPLPTRIPVGDGWDTGFVPNGRTFYYTLFFRTTPIDWIVGMSDSCLLPRDFHHRERMWDCVPPYHQWVDDNYRIGAGHLRQFLNVFGFVMDNTREFVEGVLDLHQIDKTPMPLLKGLGANYGLPYEAGIGDIRYRGLVANAPNAQHTRGTAVGLRQVIEAVSKYETQVTGSQTLVLFPDDSDFFNSTGNWGGVHPQALPPVLAQEPSLTSLDWSSIYVGRVNVAPPTGRGVMRVYTTKAQGLSNLLITCGDARIRDDPDTILRPGDDILPPATAEYRDAIPLTGGISITAGVPYGFSVWVQAPEKNFTVQAVLIWIGPSGDVDEVIDVSLGIPKGSSGTAWKQYIGQGLAPVKTSTLPEARYLIPAIYIFDRVAHTTVQRSAAIDVAAAMVYPLGDENSVVSVTPPDRYLTLGDPSEKLGEPKAGFEGFVIGSSQRDMRST